MNRTLVLVVAGLAGLSACGSENNDMVASQAAGAAPASGSASGSGSGSASTEGSPTASPSAASAGTGLDTTFASAGIAKVAMAPHSRDRLNALALGADGKLYGAGLTSKGTDQEIAVARFDTDGRPDTSFGTDGVASINVSTNGAPEPAAQLEQARSIVVQPDGKVVAVGTAEHDAAAGGDAAKDTDIVAVRFDQAGKPDASFGEDGVVRLDLGTGRAVDPETYVGADQGYGSAAMPDGGLVIFGNARAGADRDDNDWVLVRLNGSGEQDRSFGTDGVAKFDLDRGGDTARHVKVIGDRIVATGYSRGADKVVRPALIRTGLDGRPDPSFGTNGIASHKILNSVAESYAFGVQGDNYVLAGYGKDAEADTVDLVAYRFTSAGAHDTTFGTNGVTRIDNAGEDDRGRNLAVLPDGRILYAGSGKVDANNIQAMVVLLSKDGALEPGFGTNSRILTDLGSNGDAWFGLALSPDGKTAYLGGFTNASSEDVDGDDAYLGRLKIG